VNALTRLIGRELATRGGPLGEARVAVWDDGDGTAAAEIERLKAAGVIGRHTEITLVRWRRPDESWGAIA
jgi:hypothetical protein